MAENPPAFPRPGFEQPAGLQDGMTLRDYFAGQALAGLCANHGFINSASWDAAPNAVIASRAYSLADAMLAEREKGGGR